MAGALPYREGLGSVIAMLRRRGSRDAAAGRRSRRENERRSAKARPHGEVTGGQLP